MGARPPEGAIRPAAVPQEMTPKRKASMRLIEEGNELIGAKEYERAASAFRDAINIDASNGVAYYYLAFAYIMLEKPDEASGLLDKAQALLRDDQRWQEIIEDLRMEIGAPATKSFPHPSAVETF